MTSTPTKTCTVCRKSNEVVRFRNKRNQCVACEREKQKLYRELNRDKRIAWTKKWKEVNKEHVRSYHTRYCRTRRNTDPLFNVVCGMRSRLNNAVRGGIKAHKALYLLGCSLAEFKLYIEGLFLPGMSWENHGLYGWHFDHIRPLSSFDLSDAEQLKLAFHYSNIQPLWALENLRKGATYAAES